MKTLLGIQITDQEFDRLFCEQAKGKEIKVINGKLQAVEHIPTEEELKFQKEAKLKRELETLKEEISNATYFGILSEEELAAKKARGVEILNELKGV